MTVFSIAGAVMSCLLGIQACNVVLSCTHLCSPVSGRVEEEDARVKSSRAYEVGLRCEVCHTTAMATVNEAFPDGASFGADDRFLNSLHLEAAAEADRLGIQMSVDLQFYIFLRRFSRFGYFTFGPITIDVRLVGDLVERTAKHIDPAERRFEDDSVQFSLLVIDELRRSDQQRVDELHLLLAFMRFPDGLPARVFGELGVPPEQVEEFARAG